MPFTPFHMGPAATFKLFGLKYFSFTVFGFSQILIDLEVLVRIFAGSDQLHGFTNTFLGATGIGIVATLLGRPICQLCLRIWNRLSPPSYLLLPTTITWSVAAISAFIGVYSHIFLDSIMHSDARPFAPFSSANPFFNLVSVNELHLICICSGAISAVGLFAVAMFGRREKSLEETREP